MKLKEHLIWTLDNETGGGNDNTDTTKGDYDDTTINNIDDDTKGSSDIDNGTGGENGNVDTTKGNNDENTTEGVKKSIEEGSDMALMNDLFSTTEEGGNGIEWGPDIDNELTVYLFTLMYWTTFHLIISNVAPI